MGDADGPTVRSRSVPRLPRLSFRAWLAIIGLAALALRVVYTVWKVGDDPPGGDAVYFYGQAMAVADGEGFINPILFQTFDLKLQAAHHPPLFVVFLAAMSMVVGDDLLRLRLATCVLSALTVIVIGLVGRRVANERAGLAAAVVAALYPHLWLNDPLLLSEPLYGLCIALVLLTAYRLWDDPAPREALLLGAAIGFATLTRAEALLLFLILAIPLIWLCRRLDRVSRVVLVAVTLAAGGMVIAPWVVHNLYRFNEPVTLSYGLAGVLTQANCDQTYSGELLGYWDPNCSFLDERIGPSARECVREPERCAEIYAERFGDESEAAALGQELGVEYITEHKGRLPVVMSARVGRMWGLFRPAQQMRIDGFAEGRGLWGARVGLITFYELVAVGVVGLVVLRRRKVPILPLVSMAVLVTTVAALAIPVTRYRVPLEVALAVLAGVVIDQGLRWWRARATPARRRRGDPAGDDAASPAPASAPGPVRG